jgi:hypothetical protein
LAGHPNLGNEVTDGPPPRALRATVGTLRASHERRVAERVGFVPDVLTPINDLGPIGSPETAKSTQNLSIRYKTGTAQLSSVAAGHGSCSGLLNRCAP